MTKKEIELQRKALAKELSKAQTWAAKVQNQLNALVDVEEGDVPAPAIAALIKSQKFSYGVEFTRRKELNKPKNGKKGLTFLSDRRFATTKEATQHGKRFAKLHKHEDFVVVRINTKANAWVNWATGKTNPAL